MSHAVHNSLWNVYIIDCTISFPLLLPLCPLRTQRGYPRKAASRGKGWTPPGAGMLLPAGRPCPVAVVGPQVIHPRGPPVPHNRVGPLTSGGTWPWWSVAPAADVEDVKFVINFDYPSCSEDYVHRIGRTGRSQRTGTAYTFFTPNNMKQAGDLVSVLREANQVINPKLLEMSDMSRSCGGRGRNRWKSSGGGGGRMGGRMGRSRSRSRGRRDRDRGRENDRSGKSTSSPQSSMRRLLPLDLHGLTRGGVSSSSSGGGGSHQGSSSHSSAARMMANHASRPLPPSGSGPVPLLSLNIAPPPQVQAAEYISNHGSTAKHSSPPRAQTHSSSNRGVSLDQPPPSIPSSNSKQEHSSHHHHHHKHSSSSHQSSNHHSSSQSLQNGSSYYNSDDHHGSYHQPPPPSPQQFSQPPPTHHHHHEPSQSAPHQQSSHSHNHSGPSYHNGPPGPVGDGGNLPPQEAAGSYGPPRQPRDGYAYVA